MQLQAASTNWETTATSIGLGTRLSWRDATCTQTGEAGWSYRGGLQEGRSTSSEDGSTMRTGSGI